jgi:hypothetical protein
MHYTLEEVGLADPRLREPIRSTWDGLERLLQHRSVPGPIRTTAVATGEGQKERNEPETVLEVGCEGGTLAVVRQRDELGNWEYWCLRDETTMLELVAEEDAGDKDSLLEESVRLGTFEDALHRLDRYPWYHLFPMKVSADLADLVLKEIEKRGGKEAADEWTDRLNARLAYE